MLGAFYVNANRVEVGVLMIRLQGKGFKNAMVTKGALIGDFSENRGMIGRSMTLSATSHQCKTKQIPTAIDCSV